MPSLDRHLITSCVGVSAPLFGRPTTTPSEKSLPIRRRLAGWRCRLHQSRRTMPNKVTLRTLANSVLVPTVDAAAYSQDDMPLGGLGAVGNESGQHGRRSDSIE